MPNPGTKPSRYSILLANAQVKSTRVTSGSSLVEHTTICFIFVCLCQASWIVKHLDRDTIVTYHLTCSDGRIMFPRDYVMGIKFGMNLSLYILVVFVYLMYEHVYYWFILQELSTVALLLVVAALTIQSQLVVRPQPPPPGPRRRWMVWSKSGGKTFPVVWW